MALGAIAPEVMSVLAYFQDQVPTVDAAGQPLSVHQQGFALVLLGTALVAGVTHLCFLLLMLWAGVQVLAVVNVASVLCYWLMFHLARRGQLRGALIMAGVEVIGHAVLALWVLGWGSGFHYYLLLPLPVVIVSSVIHRGDKLFFTPALAGVAIGVDVAFRTRAPQVVLDLPVLNFLHYFNLVACMVILCFLAAFYFLQIQKVERQLRALATTDPLTQLSNRRALMDVIRHEERRLQRGRQVLSFVMADIDHFKQVNDTLGHDAGDEVLRQVSQTLAAGVRDIDHLARWGGEEFLIVLPDTDAGEAVQVAERLRQAVARQPVRGLPITATFGVSEVREGETAEQAISRADSALYAGKRAGRNRVQCDGAVA
ncbi:GGDEF domain-containing protein [Aquabacterium lacunae]|uniref:diguanylate cyclase n=2 Tax=Aquabacterium lacunae TaxID=2528630 RepID=A0A4V2JFC8_9BURK|nr:GGDEF domain-containing protein [Aquabacterium lacunae]